MDKIIKSLFIASIITFLLSFVLNKEYYYVDGEEITKKEWKRQKQELENFIDRDVEDILKERKSKADAIVDDEDYDKSEKDQIKMVKKEYELKLSTYKREVKYNYLLIILTFIMSSTGSYLYLKKK